MRSKLGRMVALVAALTTALPNISKVALATDISSDIPPAVYWLDGDYEIAKYMGNGVVYAGKQYRLTAKNGLKGTHVTIINLNSEIIFPTDEAPWLAEYFFGDYILTRQADKFGLLDRFGNIAVPAIYNTEKEAWEQVNIDSTLGTDPSYSPEPNIVYIEAPDSSETGLLYGFEDDKGNLLVDYQFDDAMPFSGHNYTRVNKEGRCGLLKNPLMAEVTSDWAKKEVAAAATMGLIPSRCAGYYTFEITRSQMAALLVQYCELVQGHELLLPTEHPFTDTSDTYIEKAYAEGIVQGLGDGIFAPDKVVTREQLATMLYRTITKINPGWADTVLVPDGYEDFDTISDWAKEAVSALIGKKVINGVSATRISPKSYCSTEQAIALVYRLVAASK